MKSAIFKNKFQLLKNVGISKGTVNSLALGHPIGANSRRAVEKNSRSQGIALLIKMG